MKTLKLKKGDLVIKQGEVGREIYLLCSGSLRVETNGKQINQIKSGEVFGELAYLGEMPRTADVLAECDCVVIEFPVQNLESQLAMLDDWVRIMIINLVNKVANLTEEVSHLNRVVDSALPPFK